MNNLLPLHISFIVTDFKSSSAITTSHSFIGKIIISLVQIFLVTH